MSSAALHNVLPVDILVQVFLFLKPNEYTTLDCVCRRFYATLSRDVRFSIIKQRRGVYVFGGWDGSYERNDVEFFPCWETSSEVAPPPMLHARCHPVAIVVDRMIHVIGGRCEEARLDVHEVFDPIKNTWHKRAPMLFKRSSPVILRVGRNKLYAFGGYDGKTENISAEAYDIPSDTWTRLPDMPARRSQMSGEHILGTPFILLAGGCSEASELLHKTAWLFDTEKHTYRAVAPMLQYRASAVALPWGNGAVCIAGGSSTDNTSLDTSEIYDFESNQWCRGFPLSGPRVNAAVVYDDNEEGEEPVLVGGFCNGSQLQSCDGYDAESGEWLPLTMQLNIGRDAPGAAFWT
eukprot:PhM_4_TR1677/c0_g1_i1/m.2258/K10448/KLHL10; kelch-like protein 10